MRCYNCKNEGVEPALRDETRNFADATIIVTDVPWNVCPKCGEGTITSRALGDMEMTVARALVEESVVAGDTFRFLRKAMGIKAKDVAAMFDVTPVTISRWETGEAPVDRAAWLVLAELVGKPAPERAAAIVRLQERRPRPAAKRVKLAAA